MATVAKRIRCAAPRDIAAFTPRDLVISLPFDVVPDDAFGSLFEPLSRWPIFMHEFVHFLETATTGYGLRMLGMEIQRSFQLFVLLTSEGTAQQGVLAVPFVDWLLRRRGDLDTEHFRPLAYATMLERKLQYLSGATEITRDDLATASIVQETDSWQVVSLDVSRHFPHLEEDSPRRLPFLQSKDGQHIFPLSTTIIRESHGMAHQAFAMAGTMPVKEANKELERLQSDPEHALYFSLSHFVGEVLESKRVSLTLVGLLCELSLLMDHFLIITQGGKRGAKEEREIAQFRHRDNPGWVFLDLLEKMRSFPEQSRCRPLSGEEIHDLANHLCSECGFPPPRAIGKAMLKYFEHSFSPALEPIPVSPEAKQHIRRIVGDALRWRVNHCGGLLAPWFLTDDDTRDSPLTPQFLASVLPAIVWNNAVSHSADMISSSWGSFPVFELTCFHSLIQSLAYQANSCCPITSLLPRAERQQLCPSCNHDFTDRATLSRDDRCPYLNIIDMLFCEASPIQRIDRDTMTDRTTESNATSS